MKIRKITIPEFQQFKNLELDFTHPETGKALDKICFIGKNGTGKSTLLRIINDIFRNGIIQQEFFILIEFEQKEKKFYALRHFPDPMIIFIKEQKFTELNEINDWKNWDESTFKSMFKNKEYNKWLLDITFKNNSSDLFIYSPPESIKNELLNSNNLPQTNLSTSLNLFNNFPYYHEVSNETITEFWKLLIYQIKKRENNFREFENQKENQDKTVREVKNKFNASNPSILKEIAKLWDEILGKANLEFDYENAKNPIQLTDNLEAYIKLKNTNENINYQALSTGIRNFIFRLGHIYSLYFNRNIQRGFLLIDEPENSLFPDFLYDLVGIYERITQNTQIFMATHNPIVAAQFEPHERIILDFDENGFVQSRKGQVPIGDDPNDILIKDFGIRSILGKEAVKKWERYVELKTLIPLEKKEEKKSEMMQEFMKIGMDYNFGSP